MENYKQDQENSFSAKILDLFQSMGNLFRKPRDPCDPLLPGSSFSPAETQSIKKIFFAIDEEHHATDRPKLGKYKLRGIFGEEQLERIFGQHLATGLYNWLLFVKKGVFSGQALAKSLNKKNLGPSDKKYPTVIDLTTFLFSMEALLRSFGYRIWLKNYDGLTALDLFIVIFFGQGRLEWLKRHVSMAEARQVLELLFSLVTPHSDNRSVSQIMNLQELKEALAQDEEAQKQEEKSRLLQQQSEAEYMPPMVNIPDLKVDSFLRMVFASKNHEEEQTSRTSGTKRISINQLFFHIKSSLPRTNNAIIQYFESRTILHKDFTPNPTLYNPPIAPHLPQGLKSSLLNPGTLAMLYLANSRMKSVTMTRLYSSKYNGFSFNRLAFHWVGYNASTIIVCDARDQQTNERYIIGAYCDEQIKDKARFHGNPSNFLFCLEPNFNIQRASASGTNYQYLNTRHIQKSVYGCGLGFGGDYSDHKFWIDGDDIENQSYIKAQDSTYEIGHLAGKSKKIVIKQIEIWGLGGKENLAHQEFYRQLEKSRKEKDRKVDKQAFLDSDFDKQFLLGNTFGHAKQKEDRD